MLGGVGGGKLPGRKSTEDIKFLVTLWKVRSGERGEEDLRRTSGGITSRRPFAWSWRLDLGRRKRGGAKSDRIGGKTSINRGDDRGGSLH